MSDNKVVSLDRFRKKKEEAEQEKTETENSSNMQGGKEGVLVWLQCPTCGTIEYTHVRSSLGRSHKCGTQVSEVEVDVDLRAELTLTVINIGKIQEIRAQGEGSMFQKLFSKQSSKLLDQLEQAEMMYMEKVKAAAVVKIEPYPVENEGDLKDFPIREINPLGLYISEFRYQPEKRFQDE